MCVRCRMVSAVHLEYLVPNRCEFEYHQGVWILSCVEAKLLIIVCVKITNRYGDNNTYPRENYKKYLG